MTSQKQNVIYLKILNIFTFLAMVLMNVLAEVLPLGGMTTGQISDQYQSIFTPAGITFSIWFVIYIALGYFVFWQAFSASDEIIKRIGIFFALSCAMNIAWIVSWHFNMLIISTLIILGLLVTLYIVDDAAKNANRVVRWAFSIYLAWITIASIAAMFLVIGSVFEGFALSGAAQGFAAIALLMGLWLCYRRLKDKGDAAYSIAMIWAIAGILLKHNMSAGFGGKFIFMTVATSAAIIAILVMTIMSIDEQKVEVIEL